MSQITTDTLPGGGLHFRRDGDLLAGVSTNADGEWTWWSRSTKERRFTAKSRDDAIEHARREAAS